MRAEVFVSCHPEPELTNHANDSGYLFQRFTHKDGDLMTQARPSLFKGSRRSALWSPMWSYERRSAFVQPTKTTHKFLEKRPNQTELELRSNSTILLDTTTHSAQHETCFFELSSEALTRPAGFAPSLRRGSHFHTYVVGVPVLGRQAQGPPGAEWSHRLQQDSEPEL